MRSPIFQSLRRIMDETTIGSRLFERRAVVASLRRGVFPIFDEHSDLAPLLQLYFFRE